MWSRYGITLQALTHVRVLLGPAYFSWLPLQAPAAAIHPLAVCWVPPDPHLLFSLWQSSALRLMLHSLSSVPNVWSKQANTGNTMCWETLDKSPPSYCSTEIEGVQSSVVPEKGLCIQNSRLSDSSYTHLPTVWPPWKVSASTTTLPLTAA